MINSRHRAGWVKLEGAYSALITARLAPDNAGARCIATVLARSDCWAFVKGGFVLDWASQTGVIFFQVRGVTSWCASQLFSLSGELLDNFLPLTVDLQNADKTPMKITVASGSLQPFTTDQWAMHQQDTIRKVTLLDSGVTI
jgi:hypothetical protein